jgi:hypothetical protein
MIYPWVHNEIARQRHQELRASAERYRLARIIGDPAGTREPLEERLRGHHEDDREQKQHVHPRHHTI